MTHKQKITWMAVWAAEHGCALVLNGECGIGRQCVGISIDDKYPDYEWHDAEYRRIDANGDVWVPPNAYHKHPCVAVLGLGKDAEAQLYDWLKWFDANDFVLETGETNRTDLNFLELIMGQNRYARMVRKEALK